jgi:hypothetical protein
VENILEELAASLFRVEPEDKAVVSSKTLKPWVAGSSKMVASTYKAIL